MNLLRRGIMLQVFLFCVAVYMFNAVIIPRTVSVIDPCSCTPGHDYSGAFVIIPLAIIAFGFTMFFYMIRPYFSGITNVLWCLFLLIVLPLGIAISTLIIFESENTIEWIRARGGFLLFYTFGCYNDVELTEVAFSSIFSVVYWLLLSASFICLKAYVQKRRNTHLLQPHSLNKRQ